MSRSTMSEIETRRVIGRSLLVFVAYLATARLGLFIEPVSGFATLVWPPTGIAIGTLLLGGTRLWPGVAAGALVANLWQGAPFLGASGIALGNTLEAVVAVYLLQRWQFRPMLARLRDVHLFVILAVLLSTTVSATIGTTSLLLTGTLHFSAWAYTWLAWWLGDALGALIVAPLIFGWPHRHQHHQPTAARVEQVLLFCLVVLVSILIFTTTATTERSFPLAYFIFPVLGWLALRSTPYMVMTGTLVLAMVATGATLLQRGPFAASPAVSSDLLALQVYLGVVATTTLILAAAVAERRKSQAHVETLNAQLDAKVQERTTKLRESEARLRLIVTNAPVVLFAFDRHGIVTLSEGKGLTSMGLKPGQLVGQSVFDVYRGNPGLADVKRAIAGEEFVGPPRAVGNRYLRSYYRPLRTDRGEVSEVIGVSVDVTEQQQVQVIKEEQLQHEQVLEQHEREFVSMASHQLMTPLALIRGYLSLMISGKKREGTKEWQQYVRESLAATARMSRLIKNLLTISRIENQPLRLQLEPVDLSFVAAKVCKRFTTQARTKKVALECTTDQPVWVQAHSDYLQEVLSNLVDNAVKYTAKGTVSVTVTVDNDHATVAVTDSGIGIISSDLPRIFDKFYMSKNWVERQSDSHGLGLYINKLLTKAMGGTLKVTSRVSKGSTFTLTLPLARGDHEKNSSH